ncbi:HNH endonuclease family protein [Streptomyces sp. NPDC048208]|uniref:HNH endonuclease family protein n=1 Tax=Streptomyces sp. NPDC048208 TaxID=3365515 RepID=UPI00371AFABF
MNFERTLTVRVARTALTAATLAALLTPFNAHASSAAVHAPGDTITAPIREALTQLPVRAEDRTGYQRDLFRHWVDADKDGCNTRAEVLLEEAVVAPERSGTCTLTGGQWYSPYDDRTIDGPRGLDIDHLVPLAEAWDSGASGWSPAEREAYANDLEDGRALIAVSARSNRSKADQDPSTWLPTAVGYRCTYATDWVADKTRWGLSIDATEQAALGDVLDDCPNIPISVTLAR